MARAVYLCRSDLVYECRTHGCDSQAELEIWACNQLLMVVIDFVSLLEIEFTLGINLLDPP
jgi:hypothetical protein